MFYLFTEASFTFLVNLNNLNEISNVLSCLGFLVIYRCFIFMDLQGFKNSIMFHCELQYFGLHLSKTYSAMRYKHFKR